MPIFLGAIDSYGLEQTKILAVPFYQLFNFLNHPMDGQFPFHTLRPIVHGKVIIFSSFHEKTGAHPLLPSC